MASIRPRKNQDGIITSYQIRVYRGRDELDKQLKPYLLNWSVPQGKTDKQIQKLLNEAAVSFEGLCKLGYALDSSQTFTQYAEYVINLKESSGNIKHRTIVRYKELLGRILPEIGHLKIADIRPQHLNNFYQKLGKSGERKDSKKAVATDKLLALMRDNGYSRATLVQLTGLSGATISTVLQKKSIAMQTAVRLSDALLCEVGSIFTIEDGNNKLSGKTILEHHRLIRTILSQAEKEMLIPYNPASKATPPKVIQTEANHFSEDEIIAIRQALEQEPLKWQTAIYLLLLSGCRRGELLGLRWDKVDFVGNQIHICNNLLYSTARGIYEDTTKTLTSNRYIKLPHEIMKLLCDYQNSCKEKADATGYFLCDNDFVFTQEGSAKPMAPDSLTDYCNRFSKKYNLPHINPHSFRHTHISLLLLSGVDIVTTSRRAGHAKIATTLNTYNHVMEHADETASEIFATVINCTVSFSCWTKVG